MSGYFEDDDKNLSPLSPIRGAEYDGTVYLKAWNENGRYSRYGNRYDILPIGTIQNGKLKLNLPATIDSKYLRDIDSKYLFRDDELWGYSGERQDCTGGIVSNPSKIYAGEDSFHVIVSNGKTCYVRLRLAATPNNRLDWGDEAIFFYAPSSGTITGTKTCILSYFYGGHTSVVDVKLSEGWSLVRAFWDSEDDYTMNHDTLRFVSNLSGVSGLAYDVKSYSPCDDIEEYTPE